MARSLIYLSIGLCATATAAALIGCQPQPQEIQTPPGQAYLDARATLRQAAEDPAPQVRTKALEALAATQGLDAGGVMLQSLRDEYAPVRFAAALAVGDTRYRPAKAAVKVMLDDDATPPKLRCALIYALHRLGDDSHTGRLGQLLHDENKWVRATAAMIMGRMGEPSAVGPLKSLQDKDRDPVVQLQVVEALSNLGDERSMVLLEAFARNQYMEDRIIAVQALGRVDSMRSRRMLKRLLRDRTQEPVVRVAAAGSLGKLGEDVEIELPIRAINDPQSVLRKARGRKAVIRQNEITDLQVMAILSLGYIEKPLAVDVNTLAPLLKSPDGGVRVATAETILKLLRMYKPSKKPYRLEVKKIPVEVKKIPETQPATEPATRPTLHSSGGKD